MSATEKVINDLNAAKLMLCNPIMLNPEMCVRIGQAITSAIYLLKEQEEEIENLKQTAQSMMEGICLLKEQEAIPVVQREIAHMLFWCCGSCGVAITDGDKFCRNCGRAVKWNERDHHRST